MHVEAVHGEAFTLELFVLDEDRLDARSIDFVDRMREAVGDVDVPLLIDGDIVREVCRTGHEAGQVVQVEQLAGRQIEHRDRREVVSLLGVGAHADAVVSDRCHDAIARRIDLDAEGRGNPLVRGELPELARLAHGEQMPETRGADEDALADRIVGNTFRIHRLSLDDDPVVVTELDATKSEC